MEKLKNEIHTVKNGNKWYIYKNDNDNTLNLISYEDLIVKYYIDKKSDISIDNDFLSPTSLKHKNKFFEFIQELEVSNEKI